MKQCSDCNKETRNLIRGMCRKCYDHHRRKVNKEYVWRMDNGSYQNFKIDEGTYEPFKVDGVRDED